MGFQGQPTPTDSRVKDRVAVITGGSSGLGAASARRFAASGARIIVADLKSSGIEQEIQDKYGKDRAVFVNVDVTKESSIESLVKEATQWGGRLDIICNYAGASSLCLLSRSCEANYRSCIGIAVETAQGFNKRAHEADVADFDKLHAVNERGVWLCCKYALKQLLDQEPREPNARGDRTRGWIVNAASILGLVGHPFTSCYVPGTLSRNSFNLGGRC